MEINKLKGLGVAMVTPFDAQGNLDLEGLKRLTKFLIDGGVDYLVVQGTTGESPVLTKEEKQITLDTVIEVNQGQLPIVFGIGGNNTMSLIHDFKTYNLKGVDAILSASPYYNKPTQEGIFQHYKMLSENSPLPIIVYNVPGRTASNILPETTLRLASDFQNIVAIKEASGNMEQIMHLIQNSPTDFLVISGDDAITLPILACGGDGVISVVGNAFPHQFKQMVAAAMADQMPLAREVHYRVLPIIYHLFAEGNPGGIKAVLEHLEIIEAHLRLPLVPISYARKLELIELTNLINV